MALRCFFSLFAGWHVEYVEKAANYRWSYYHARGRCALPSASGDVQRASRGVQRCSVCREQRGERGTGKEREKRENTKDQPGKSGWQYDGDVSYVWDHDHCWSSFRSCVYMCMRTHRGELTCYINWEWIEYSRVESLPNVSRTHSVGATETM